MTTPLGFTAALNTVGTGAGVAQPTVPLPLLVRTCPIVPPEPLMPAAVVCVE